MPVLKPENIQILTDDKDEGQCDMTLEDLARHANWYEKWAIAFTYRLIDRVHRAARECAEDLEKLK